MDLKKQMSELEKAKGEFDAQVTQFKNKQTSDILEINTLKKACQLQKKDLERLEETNKNLQVNKIKVPQIKIENKLLVRD